MPIDYTYVSSMLSELFSDLNYSLHTGLYCYTGTIIQGTVLGKVISQHSQ